MLPIFWSPLPFGHVLQISACPQLSQQFPPIHLTNSSKHARGGTVHYQAPELLRRGHNNTESDVYAFAYVAYELLMGKRPFVELHLDSAVIAEVLAGSRPSATISCANNSNLNGLWGLIQDCWQENLEMHPTAAQIVGRLLSPAIQATKTLSTTDWDHTFTSKFRRSLQLQPLLPTVAEIKHMIFGDDAEVTNIRAPNHIRAWSAPLPALVDIL
ncbi:Protein kinase domain-containing protein [Mycena sanguinolenta]|uniref:Protein kinase domain-containing protein n=1 Tax=Mycena sanguinolenta TaxID=230812 RepID=A0A8H6X676_9AGAR|nr:Protein kinase domain-containing protein [Mycena sanguinolenta]